VVLESRSLQRGLNADLAHTPAGAGEALRRTAEIAAHLAQSGFVAIVAAVSSTAAERDAARKIGGKSFFEVHVDAGADQTYEPPGAPDLRLDARRHDLASNALQIEQLLASAGVIAGGTAGGEFAI
jgi:bifunctional enzyme CysN/CysC